MGKNKPGFRTKGNVKASSSSKAAELCNIFTTSTENPFLINKEEQLDAEFLIANKKLSKKDSNTRIKGLQEIKQYIDSKEKLLLIPIIPSYFSSYAKAVLDDDKQVRELSNECLWLLLSKVREDSPRHLGDIAAVWLISQCDTNASVAALARKVFEETFKEGGRQRFVLMFQSHIIGVLKTNLYELQAENLTLYKTTEADLIEARHTRVLTSSIDAFTRLIMLSDEADRPKLFPKLLHVLFDERKFWAFGRSTHASLKRAFLELMASVVDMSLSINSSTLISTPTPHTLTASTPHNTTTPISQPHGTQTTSILTLQTYKKVDDNDKTAYSETDNAKTTQTSAIEIPSPDIVNDKQKDANTDNSIKDTVIDKNEASNDNTENNLADDKLNVGDNITNDLSNQTVLTTEHKTSIMKIILQVCTETNISVLPSFWRCFSVVLTALPDCWNYAKAEQTFSSKLWIILKKCHSVQNSHPNILSIVAHLPTNIKYHPLFYLQLLKTLSFSLKDNELRLGGQLKKIIAKTLMDNLKQYLTDIEFVSEGDHNDEKIMAIMGSLLEDSLLIAKCYPYADKIHLNIWGLFVFFHQIITNPVCSSNKKLRLESNYKIYANKIVEVIQKALEVDDSVQVRNKLVEFLNASNLEERTGRKKSVTFKEELLEDNEKMIDMTALGEHFHNSKMLDLYAKDSVFKDFVDEILLLCLKQLSSSNKHMYDNLNVHIVFTFFFRVYGQAELFKRFSNELDPNNRDQDYSEVITTKLLFSLIEKCSASNLSLVLKNIIFFSNFQAEQKEKYFFLRNYMRKNKDSLRNIGDIMKCFMARTQKDDSFKALFNEWVHEDKWAGDWFENNAIECCQKYLNLERDLQLWLPFAYSLANLKNPFSILNKLKPMIEACLSSDKVQVVVELLCKIIANLNEQNPHSVSNPSSLWFALKLLQTCLGEYAVNDFTYMQSLHTFINFFQIVLHKNSSEAGFSLENFQLLKQIKETIYNKIYEELIDTQTMDVWVDVMDKIMKITTNHTKEMIEFFPEKKGPQEIVLFWLQSKLFESYYELASNKEVHSMLHLSQITAYTTRFCNVFGELFHCKQNHTFLVYYKGFIEMFHRFLKFFFSEDIAAEVVQNILQRCFTHQENSELQLLSLVYFKGNTKIFDNTLNTSLKKLCDNFHSSYDEEILKCIMVLSLRCHVNFIGQSNAALRAWFDSTLSFETSKEKTSILTMVNVILKQSTDAETTKNLITNSHRYLKNVDQQLFLFDTLFNKEFSKFNCQVLQLYQSYYKLFCEEEVSEKSSTGATTLDKPIESEAENLDASEDILYEIWDSVSCSCYKWLQTITNTVSSNDKCFEVPLFKEFILNALNLLKTIQKYLPTAAKKHPSVMEEWHNVLEVSMMQHLCRLFKAPGLWDDVRTELCVCLHECPLQCLPTILPSVSSQATFDPDDNYSLDTYEAINELIVYFFTLLCPAGTPGNLKLSLHLQLFAHSLLKKLLQRYELLLSWRSQEKLVESGGEQFDLDFFAKVVIKAQKKILTSFDAKLYSKNFININHKPHMLSYFEYHLLFDLFIDVSRLYPSEFEKCLSTWPSPAEFFSNHMDILFSFIHDSPPKQLINDSINNLFSYFSFFFPPTHYIDGFSDIELYVLKYFNLKPLHHPLICLQQPLDEEAVISSSSMREIAFRTYVRTCHNMVLMIRPWFFKLGKTRSEFVNNYTTKYVSDGYIGKEMSSLKLKEGDLLPKMSIRQGSKQVSVSYKVDETQISLRVTYPSNAPLGNVSIEKDLDKISNMKKDVEMLIFRIFQLLQFREGSLADALELWYQTLDQEFDGRSCMICHSILATQDGNKYLPTIHCKTCHNRFHKSCLYTWFKSSNKSLCPLCRNEFVLL